MPFSNISKHSRYYVEFFQNSIVRRAAECKNSRTLNLYHDSQHIIAYLWTKYLGVHFSDLVPYFFNLTRSLQRVALNVSFVHDCYLLAATFSTVHRNEKSSLPLARLDLSQSAKNWYKISQHSITGTFLSQPFVFACAFQ